MKTYTNYSPGMRGITVNSEKGPYVHYLDSGKSVKLDPKDVIALPDMGEKPASDAADGSDDLAAENAELMAQVEAISKERDALLAENAELKSAASEPGPLDQSIEKLTEYLEGVTDADEVQKLIDAETAGKSRAGAITALEARRDALLA